MLTIQSTYGSHDSTVSLRRANMPIIKVELWTGRTKEQKAELAKAITDVVVNIARTTPDETIVIFQDVDKENWSKAGVMASEW